MRRVSVNSRRLISAAGIAFALAGALAAGPALAEAALYAAPALLLLVALLARRYPGELPLRAALERARARSAAPDHIASPRPAARVRVVRGGLLLASSLAVRPPPARLAAS
jgi:hypothetical protein